jgi:hypothetical protein
MLLEVALVRTFKSRVTSSPTNSLVSMATTDSTLLKPQLQTRVIKMANNLKMVTVKTQDKRTSKPMFNFNRCTTTKPCSSRLNNKLNTTNTKITALERTKHRHSSKTHRHLLEQHKGKRESPLKQLRRL